jgi:7,8-dihydroneopterin aldolase/epimerase/oxygenase
LVDVQSTFEPLDAGRQVLQYALRVRGILVESRVGVSEKERSLPQRLIVSVEVELPGKLYPDTDDLAHAADYAEVVRLTDEAAREGPKRLLETFALGVARRVSGIFAAAQRVRVSVTKAQVPVQPPTDDATVEVTLGPGAR